MAASQLDSFVGVKLIMEQFQAAMAGQLQAGLYQDEADRIRIRDAKKEIDVCMKHLERAIHILAGREVENNDN